MNTGTPIIKIHKLQHFITRLKMPNYHESNFFTITKAPDWIKRLTQKWIIRMAVVAMRRNIKM